MFRKKRCERKRSRDLGRKIRINFLTQATNTTKVGRSNVICGKRSVKRLKSDEGKNGKEEKEVQKKSDPLFIFPLCESPCVTHFFSRGGQ